MSRKPTINSRSKGKTGELEVRDLLLPVFPDCGRNFDQVSSEGFRLKGDLKNTGTIHVEVKRREVYRVDEWLEQAETDAGGRAVPVVFFRKNHQPWRVIAPASHYIDLLRSSQ